MTWLADKELLKDLRQGKKLNYLCVYLPIISFFRKSQGVRLNERGMWANSESESRPGNPDQGIYSSQGGNWVMSHGRDSFISSLKRCLR